MALLFAFSPVVLPASQNSPLPEDYFELIAAIRNLAAYRLTIALDMVAWLILSGFFVTLAAILPLDGRPHQFALPTLPCLVAARTRQLLRGGPRCQMDTPRLRSQPGRTFSCQERGR